MTSTQKLVLIFRMIPRILEKNIKDKLFQGKAIILYGPRQVGKSTLIKKILTNYKSLYLDGEEFVTQQNLNKPRIDYLNSNFKGLDLLVIDEAQKIPNIGSTLKLLVDHLPSLQVIASGSSSFDLANKISEPLTGRKYTFKLFPVSLLELTTGLTNYEISSNLEKYLVYGLYPEIVSSENSQKEEKIRELSNTYLYNDLINFAGVLDRDVLFRLLKMLALQIGSEVSYHELGINLGIDQSTVKRYLEILEKSFIVKTLSAYSNNPRTEISKKKKVYFWDCGVRNSLIENFTGLENRLDVGALWENFCVMERVKYLNYKKIYSLTYFWRNYAGNEVDFIEESGGKLQGFEFKFSYKKKYKTPLQFKKLYPGTEIKVVNQDNWTQLLS